MLRSLLLVEYSLAKGSLQSARGDRPGQRRTGGSESGNGQERRSEGRSNLGLYDDLAGGRQGCECARLLLKQGAEQVGGSRVAEREGGEQHCAD